MSSRLVYTTNTQDARVRANKPRTIAAIHRIAGSGKSEAFTQDTCTCDPCRIQRCEIEGNTARPCEQLDRCAKCGTPLTSEERLLHAIFGTCPDQERLATLLRDMNDDEPTLRVQDGWDDTASTEMECI